MYNKREWLNKENSPSTGNIVAFDGLTTWKGEKIRNTFLSISDCYSTIRLHPTEDENMDDFIDKMKLLRDNVNEFISYLENNKETPKQCFLFFVLILLSTPQIY